MKQRASHESEVLFSLSSCTKTKACVEEIKIKYCSVCGEPTEKILDNPIKSLNLYTLPILCACGRKEREEYDRYVQERNERQHEELLERLRNNCFYNSKMHKWTFDVSNTCECIEKAKAYGLFIFK